MNADSVLIFEVSISVRIFICFFNFSFWYFILQELSQILYFLLQVCLCFTAIYYCLQQLNHSHRRGSSENKYCCERKKLHTLLLHLIAAQWYPRDITRSVSHEQSKPAASLWPGCISQEKYDEETKKSLIIPRASITSACLSLLHFSGIILHYISAAWYVLISSFAIGNCLSQYRCCTALC